MNVESPTEQAPVSAVHHVNAEGIPRDELLSLPHARFPGLTPPHSDNTASFIYDASRQLEKGRFIRVA